MHGCGAFVLCLTELLSNATFAPKKSRRHNFRAQNNHKIDLKMSFQRSMPPLRPHVKETIFCDIVPLRPWSL